MAEIYYDDRADLGVIQRRHVAVLGYGSQGHAHALSLRDSGVDVRVGLPEGSASRDKAASEGLQVTTPEKACEEADVIMVLAPDHIQRALYAGAIAPSLDEGDALFFAHGLNIRYGLIDALATTFAEETETDLFGEQVVLCGGVSELIKAGFDTLVEAGYQPEVAYFECLHEMKLIVDLMYEGGLSKMYWSVSDTAEYGGYTRGPRLIDERSKEEMRRILGEVQDGSFARELVEEFDSGRPNFLKRREALHAEQIEQVGAKLRPLMSWLADDDDQADA